MDVHSWYIVHNFVNPSYIIDYGMYIIQYIQYTQFFIKC